MIVNVLYFGVVRIELGRYMGIYGFIFFSIMFGFIFWLLVKSFELVV